MLPLSTFKCEVVAVKDIQPMEGKDRIELAYVLGWQCIVAKGKFKVGDKGVYVPIDSIIPEKLAEELGIAQYLKNGERLKSMKLGGYLSQGLLIAAEKKDSLGDDVAKRYGITKWEPPAPTFQQQIRTSGTWNINPDFHKYSDLENVKNYTNVFEEGEEIVLREKIHGTNARFAKLEYKPRTLWDKAKNWIRLKVFKGDEFILYVGTRNTQVTDGNPKTKKGHFKVDGGNLYEVIAERYDLARLLPNNYQLYGEIYGPGIQDLIYGTNRPEVTFFDLKVDGEYVDDSTMENFCRINGLPVAPLLYKGPYSEGILKEHTCGKSCLDETQIREGCVVKTAREKFHARFGRMILKSISEDYLLRKGGTEFH